MPARAALASASDSASADGIDLRAAEREVEHVHAVGDRLVDRGGELDRRADGAALVIAAGESAVVAEPGAGRHARQPVHDRQPEPGPRDRSVGAGDDARDVRPVLRDVGIEGEVVGVRRVIAGEAAGDDHATAREAPLPAREAGRRPHARRREERRAGIDAVVDHPDLDALAGGRAVGAPERDGAHERRHGVACRRGRSRRGRRRPRPAGAGRGPARAPAPAAPTRVEHDAVAALHGGAGHIGAQPCRERVLHARAAARGTAASRTTPRRSAGRCRRPSAACVAGATSASGGGARRTITSMLAAVACACAGTARSPTATQSPRPKSSARRARAVTSSGRARRRCGRPRSG